MDEEYRFDQFNDGSEKLVGEQHLNKLKKFIADYEKQLEDIENALNETLSQIWDATIDPIRLSTKPYEQTTLVQLIKTDNKVFNKVILVFSSLCVEVNHLKETAIQKFYGPLKLFGEIIEEDGKEAGEGDSQVQFGRMFHFLLDLSKFVQRCYGVTKNIISQMASLYHNQQRTLNSFKSVHLQSVFESLMSLFGVLISLDEIIQANVSFQNYIALYKRMVKAIKSDPSRYNADEERLWQVEKLLYSIKGQLLDGRIFQNCIEQEFDTPGVLDVSNNKDLKKEMLFNVKAIFTALNQRIGDQTEINQRYSFVGFSGLYVFYITLFKDTSDSKFFKSVWELHKKLPLVHIFGDITWSLNDFYSKTVPMMLKLIKNSDLTPFKRDYLKKLDTEFSSKVQNFYLQVCIWMVRMESNLTNRADIQNILNTRIVLLSQGVTLAYSVSNLFKEVVSLHLLLSTPLKSKDVKHLSQCIELLKSIQATFHRRSSMIGETISLMIQQIQSYLNKYLIPIQNKLESSGVYNKKSDSKLDCLAAVTLALQMLNNTPTIQRRTIVKLALHLLQQSEFLREEEIEEFNKQFEKLELLAELEQHILDSCNTSYLYWSRSMLPNYFMDVYSHPYESQKLPYMFAGLRDIIPLFKKMVHDNPTKYIDSYIKEIDTRLKTFILDPLCRDIETDLRLHIHAHLAISDRNPWKNGVKDLSRFFKIRPIRFYDKSIDIKRYVSHYLDTTFYNLTTIALHDWKTYGEMRNLAQEKYGLNLTEVHLPSQTLEQGIDVLQIMRNIHIFVARYNYNIHNQIFIERTSDSKTLNTITINHISNSIRTHGIGIMNTTVNFIYQFLRQKFAIFSQFLYDDHIKSRLYRDIRYYKESREQLDNKYPFERAQKFNKEIKKLGVNDLKQSYLDQFRTLITEIGNAMGYIRMIRSGGFHYISNAIKFVPDLEDIVNFEECSTKENLSSETVEATKNLDHAIECLSKNFSEGTEYFRMLVNVFAPEFRSQQNLHLKNFYIIVPPLTVNFVEHILLGKEKLTKKKATGGFFTDDGFAIGVAYILKLLDQYKQFDSLHWFEEVQMRYAEEQKNLQLQLSKQKKEEQQTAVLTLKRLKAYQMEFELLRFSFDGARIFFKTDKEESSNTQQQQQQDSNTSSTPAPDAATTITPAVSNEEVPMDPNVPPPPPPPF